MPARVTAGRFAAAGGGTGPPTGSDGGSGSAFMTWSPFVGPFGHNRLNRRLSGPAAAYAFFLGDLYLEAADAVQNFRPQIDLQQGR
jgi:hypothetical protein